MPRKSYVYPQSGGVYVFRYQKRVRGKTLRKTKRFRPDVHDEPQKKAEEYSEQFLKENWLTQNSFSVDDGVVTMRLVDPKEGVDSDYYSVKFDEQDLPSVLQETWYNIGHQPFSRSLRQSLGAYILSKLVSKKKIYAFYANQDSYDCRRSNLSNKPFGISKATMDRAADGKIRPLWQPDKQRFVVQFSLNGKIKREYFSLAAHKQEREAKKAAENFVLMLARGKYN